MAVVKAGAYGHGLEAIAKELELSDVSFLGVANVGEARRLRKAGIRTPIYLLGATWQAEREEIVALKVTPCISSLQEAIGFNEIAETRGTCLPAHLAVDTGMGRGGFLPVELPSKLPYLLKLQHIRLEGIASHFSCSDEDAEVTQNQILAFSGCVSELSKSASFKHIHIANSAGLIDYTCDPCNLSRPGLMLYGVSPLLHFQQLLRPVMTLKSRVSLVRVLPPGQGISYGRTYVTKAETKVATIGIGYGDGLPRAISGQNGQVYIRGSKFPIIGRVTMDQTIAELPMNSGIEAGDEVEIFGTNISAADLAKQASTIPWEIFTGITPRVERIYKNATSVNSNRIVN